MSQSERSGSLTRPSGPFMKSVVGGGGVSAQACPVADLNDRPAERHDMASSHLFYRLDERSCNVNVSSSIIK